MKVLPKRPAMRLAVIGLALGLAVVGCSKDDSKAEESSASSSATSSAESSAETSAPEEADSTTAEAAAGDLSVLLMKPESIPPNAEGPFVGEAPKVEAATPDAPATVSQYYKSGDNSMQSVIIVMPDAEKAAISVKNTMSSPELTAQITGTAEPAPNVTEDAMVINGTSADGSASMAILMFSEDTAVVQVTFVGPLNDPVPPDFLESVGVIQLDAVQQNLPNLEG